MIDHLQDPPKWLVVATKLVFDPYLAAAHLVYVPIHQRFREHRFTRIYFFEFAEKLITAKAFDCFGFNQ